MEQNSYYQPDTCIPGKLYYIKTSCAGLETRYKSVKFVCYRPHPAEIIIREGDRIRVVHRVYLYQKNNGRK